MKIWNTNNNIDKKIENFTIGNDNKIDNILAKYDVIGTIAHVKMLKSIGFIKDQELLIILKFLREIYHKIEKKNFNIENNIEDIHSKIEIYLTNKIGILGKKIHTGRSRNDQILLDIKLFTRHEIKEIVFLIKDLFNLLIDLSEDYKNIIIPGYTHYQIAMPSSFGLWFSSYAESFLDDVIILYSVYKMINKNPLGSAAGYGSSLPLKRKITTELLGFEDLNYNVVYAQMCRGKTEKIVSSAIANIAYTLSKMSQDICLYINENYNFISFPDNLTTGSSIMPHKKNPDVFELIRANCNKIISLPNEISIIIGNLCSGYHRDFQIIKENYISLFDRIKICLDITKHMFENIIIKKDIINDKKYKYIFSVELINKLVKEGIPFRDAYKKISLDIKENKYDYTNIVNELDYTHEGSIGNLCNKEICNSMYKIIKSFPFKKVDLAINKLIYE